MCCFTDGGRPPGVAGQTEAPNRLKGLQSRAEVPSFREKAAEKQSGMNRRGEEHESHMRRRDSFYHSQKRGPVPVPLEEQAYAAGGLFGCRRRCGTTPESGCRAEHGNQKSRCQGSPPSSSPARSRVPRRDTGADQPVVAEKSRKAGWSEGAEATGRSIRSTREGRSL